MLLALGLYADAAFGYAHATVVDVGGARIVACTTCSSNQKRVRRIGALLTFVFDWAREQGAGAIDSIVLPVIAKEELLRTLRVVARAIMCIAHSTPMDDPPAVRRRRHAVGRRLLLVRRHRARVGLVEPAGGRVEFGETLAEACARTVRGNGHRRRLRRIDRLGRASERRSSLRDPRLRGDTVRVRPARRRAMRRCPLGAARRGERPTPRRRSR